MESMPDTIIEARNLRLARSWALVEGLLLLFSLVDTAGKCLLMVSCCTHRPMQCSTPVREASSHDRNPQLANVQRPRDSEQLY